MIIDLGLIDYEEAYSVQKEFVRRRKFCEIDDTVIFAEHMSVFTIGRTGKMANLLVGEDALAAEGIKVLRLDRGGDITFHGPGQLVAYPILDLRQRKRDLHGYLRDLEAAVINFLGEYGLAGTRASGRTGVWVGDEKIASIGIGCSDWITYHGLSVNIDVEPRFFAMINPCGMIDGKVVSLGSLVRTGISMDDAKAVMARCLERKFDLERP